MAGKLRTRATLTLPDEGLPMQPSRDIHRLIEIMAALRDPDRGCPWDVEQSFASIAPYTIEEAYEVADAIERGDTEDLREELGDLLLQVVFHARMAEEAGLFDFCGVVEAITTKLIRRHPHVFGDARELDAEAVKALWGRIKADEKRVRAEARRSVGVPAEARSGALGGVPLSQPALSRALKLQEKAGKVGFDWDDVRAVVAKLREEIAEVEAEIGLRLAEKLSDEVGDLLFAAVNLARHLDVDPEAALRGANAKFERRFAHIEQRLAESGRKPEGVDLDEMDALWLEAKGLERRTR
jgi:nucleoside triphosphate diphosphatase